MAVLGVYWLGGSSSMTPETFGLTAKELLVQLVCKLNDIDEKLDAYVVSCEVNAREIQNIKTLGGIALTVVGGVLVGLVAL